MLVVVCLLGLCPLVGHGRRRGGHPVPRTRQPSPGPTSAPSATAMGPAPRGRAARAAAPPAGQGGDGPCAGSLPARLCPLPPGSPAPLRPARLRLSAARLQLPAEIRCRRAGSARKHLFPTWGRWGGRASGAARPRRGLPPLTAAVTRPYNPRDHLSERSHSVFTCSAEKRVSTLSSRVVFFHRVRSGGWWVGGHVRG